MDNRQEHVSPVGGRLPRKYPIPGERCVNWPFVMLSGGAIAFWVAVWLVW